jgi:uncharacterized coiled-coil protein SlyX
MTLQQFIAEFTNVGIDNDHAYGNQCVDLYDAYCAYVINCPIILVNGAINIFDNYPTAYFDRIANSPDPNLFPHFGDVVIWGAMGNNPYGHVAVCINANSTSFTSFDQNWPPGSTCHQQNHNYDNVIGWLRPKTMTGGEDMNTPETNEILYKTVLGRSQGTVGDAGAANNLNKPLEEVMTFMWNTDEAKNFQTWLSTVKDQFPKLQATVDQLTTSLSQQTIEMDSLNTQLNGQGKIIDEQETTIAELTAKVKELSDKPPIVCPEPYQGLPAITLSSILDQIKQLIQKWLKT